MKRSRRDFLKLAGVSALGLGAAPVLEIATKTAPLAQAADATAETYAHNPNALKAKHWGMVIDTRKFDSHEKLQAVIDACHKAHNVPDIPGHKDVKWIWTETFEGSFPEKEQHYVSEEVEHRKFLLLCNHCQEPACVRVCPTKATFKRESDGIVMMDMHRCIGCRFCMAACPFGARSFNFGDPRPYIKEPNPEYPTRMRGVVEKCTFCTERLAKGLMPACVEVSDGAILFGDLDDAESEVRKALRENFSIRRKPSLGTQPSVYYII